MNYSDQRKITKNLIILQRALKDDINYITEKLYEQEVFSSEARREICEIRCRLPLFQCGVFVNHLLRSGEHSYNTFKNILIDMGHQGLVTAMEKSEYKEKVLNWTEDRGKTFVLPDLKLPDRTSKQAWIEAVEEKDGMCTESGKPDEVKQLERLTTFVLTKLDRKSKQAWIEAVEDKDKLCTESSKPDEVQQLERLATFVLTKLDRKDSNNSTIHFGEEFKQKLEKESKGTEELSELFKTLNVNRFQLTAESLAH